jgi:hypothetical protein
LLLVSEVVVSSSERKRFDFAPQIDGPQQLANAFRAHRGVEVVAVLLDLGQVVILGQQLATRQRRHARVEDHEGLEVKHPFDVAQGHVEHHAQAARQALQEPDMSDRAGQFDVRHPLATNLGQRHFDATFLADDATMLEPLVLAAKTLVVLDRAKNLGAEQTVTLRLEGPVVDRLRLLHFAVRPRADLVRRGKANGDRIELLFLRHLSKQIQQCFHLLLQ